MTHRAETVMDAVETAITGLSTTGTNVFRGRVSAKRAEGNLPALVLHLGADEPDPDESAFPRLYQELALEIEAVVTAAAGYEAQLLDIREEVTVALRTDYTLGLGFVQEAIEDTADKPEPADENGRRFTQTLNWRVRYSRSWDDPSA